MTILNCTTCGKPFVKHTGSMKTLVGYFSPPGHDHDDNCEKRIYLCEDGHWTFMSVRRRCTTPGCNWVGKEDCFCHEGKKVDAWPEEVTEMGKEEFLKWLHERDDKVDTARS